MEKQKLSIEDLESGKSLPLLFLGNKWTSLLIKAKKINPPDNSSPPMWDLLFLEFERGSHAVVLNTVFQDTLEEMLYVDRHMVVWNA